MIVAGVWTGVGFSNLKSIRTRIKKFWNRNGVGESDSGHLCLTGEASYEDCFGAQHGLEPTAMMCPASPPLKKQLARTPKR